MGIDISIVDLNGEEQIYLGFGYGDLDEDDPYILRAPHIARFIFGFLNWESDDPKPMKYDDENQYILILRGYQFLLNYGDMIQENKSYNIPHSCAESCILKIENFLDKLNELRKEAIFEENKTFYWHLSH